MQNDSKPLILVTGMSGLIGTELYNTHRDAYRWRGLNRRNALPGVETVLADISDLDAIRPAFDGVHTVVHLAADIRTDSPWEVIHPNNIVGTYNVFEAARQAGVQRIVFASSGSVMAGVQREEPYKAIAEGRYADVPAQWPLFDHRSMVRPVGLYGVSKVFGEVLARYYVDVSPLSILCLRIGWVGERPTQPVHFANWCSCRDAVQMIARAIQAPPELRYDIFFVTSENRWSYRDLTHAREVLGFVPQDRAEDYR